jgi:origin recognition complex subunit 3
MTSDNQLRRAIPQHVEEARCMLEEVANATKLLHVARGQIASLSSIPISSLHLQALAGELKGSALLREFLLSIKKSSSNILSRMLSVMTPFVSAPEDQKSLDDIRRLLNALLQQAGASEAPLKSQYDLKNETMRTTVVAHKVELSRHRANMSADDAAYSKIVDQFHDWMATYMDEKLVAASDILLNEIVMYDGRGPDKAVFMPRNRFVVERALSSPHDYLSCECCRGTGRDEAGEVRGRPVTERGSFALLTLEVQSALSKSQPPTALLYQLYLESGSTINVADLWTAFNGILTEDEEQEEEGAGM